MRKAGIVAFWWLPNPELMPVGIVEECRPSERVFLKRLSQYESVFLKGLGNIVNVLLDIENKECAPRTNLGFVIETVAQGRLDE